ncbi:hypothetical protein [Natronosalvus hydrolyticus]|uniref:hypothetical protein n=1 Tax=Natronosalvus hydrolyticus TaxID=2979988 RepID=UPI00319EB85F
MEPAEKDGETVKKPVQVEELEEVVESPGDVTVNYYEDNHSNDRVYVVKNSGNVSKENSQSYSIVDDMVFILLTITVAVVLSALFLYGVGLASTDDWLATFFGLMLAVWSAYCAVWIYFRGE